MARSVDSIVHLIVLSLAVTFAPLSARSAPSTAAKNLKVYVMVGFHVDFYHSWRGDTPDDAGYGYDVKIIRSSIRKLNEATAKGLKAKAYWDFAGNNWTLGEFVPKHFPDMIPLFQSRDGIDEFVAGPFNNGMGAATTKKEFLKSVEWTLSNPSGYGLKQLFKNVGTSYRPQEMSIASHQNRWLKEAGIESLILYYAACAFDAFSPFIAPLNWEERLNPLWMKTNETDEPIVVLPAMSPIDIVNYVSPEKLMTELRAKQLSGEIKRNVAIHLNMDADALSWEPVVSNRLLRSVIPNAGGLQEMIDAVNKYQWADFTTPREYLKIEKPQKTIIVRQDTADGSFTGMASWAEKENTGRAWPKVERSRVIERLLESRNAREKKSALWLDTAFVDRLLALSTTHYGMATPFVHRERAVRLDTYTDHGLALMNKELGGFLDEQGVKSKVAPSLSFFEHPRFGQPLTSPSGTSGAEAKRAKSVQHQSFTLPVSVKGGPRGLAFIRRPLNAATDVIETFRTNSQRAREDFQWDTNRDTKCEPQSESTLTAADRLRASFSKTSGLESLSLNDQSFGSRGLFDPFVSWKSKVSIQKGLQTSVRASQVRIPSYTIHSQICATAPDIKETLVSGSFLLKAPKIEQSIEADYRFWTHADVPYLFVDVAAYIPVTVDDTADQPVDRRYMSHVDYRLQELALAQLKPDLGSSKTSDLRVWKMNYEGELSYYSVDYEKFNAKNLNLDSINNHLTPGWVAVSNGEKGFLVAFQTSKRASFGAVPMRVRGNGTTKDIYLNPFGTYFGRQFDYSHVGGEKLGTLLANLGGVFVRPNAPSFSGKNIHFELMIAPYVGDQPSQELVQAALQFAYPAVGILSTHDTRQDDFQGEQISFGLLARARELRLYGSAVTAPVGLAVTPIDRGARIMWQSTHPEAVAEYEVSYRRKNPFAKWSQIRTKATTLTLGGLVNHRRYEVYVRAVGKADANGAAKMSTASRTQTLTPTDRVKDAFVNEISPSPKLLWMFMNSVVKHSRTEDPDQ